MNRLLAILGRLFAAQPVDPAAVVAAQFAQIQRMNQENAS